MPRGLQANVRDVHRECAGLSGVGSVGSGVGGGVQSGSGGSNNSKNGGAV